MAIATTFHKAVGSTTEVLNSWIKSQTQAETVLESAEDMVEAYAKENKISFREAKKQFPSYQQALDDYNFWCDSVAFMRAQRKEAQAIW